MPRIIGPITVHQVSPIYRCWVHRRGDTQMQNATRILASSTRMRKSFANFGNKLYPPGSWAVARILRLVWNQLDALRASCRNSLCPNGSTSCFDRLEFHLEWCGACGLHSPICPSHDIFLHCDPIQPCSCGISHHGWTGREYPRNVSSCIYSWASSRWSTRDPPASSRNGARGVALSWCSNWESIESVLDESNLLFSSVPLRKKCPHVQ